MSIESDQIQQLQADLAAVWERKRELDGVERALRAENAALRAEIATLRQGAGV